MSELKCPHCGQVFVIDESQYDAIVAQVRTAEFRSSVDREVQLVRDALSAQHNVEIHEALAKATADSNAREQSLLGQLSAARTEAAKLRGEVQLAEQKQNIAVMQAREEEKARAATVERQLTTQLEYYKDLKTRMSTKMVGESLEQHCLTEFNRIRALAFPNAYFEKDNTVSASGSKGDFIFREDVDGVPLVSIMFEMKNEMDTTATKHRNEDFLRELDKDRKEKGCEYAVLVSLLEADSDYYNDGIVDMSHRYPKMYVIRPQFFIPLISVLRGAAMNALTARYELQRLQNMNLDFIQFESNISAFRDAVQRNYSLASRQFQTAIDEIDKSIDHLQKVKAAMLSSERNLRLLNDKADDLSVRKLTKNAPVVRDMFKEHGIE